MPRRVSVASLAINNQPHALYRFFDRTDVLLYVGITANLPTRMKNHSKGKPWWTQIHNITIEHFDTRQDALDAERCTTTSTTRWFRCRTRRADTPTR